MDWCNLLPGDWNNRILTLDDFETFCDEDGVKVFELSMSQSGLYTIYHGVPVILLSRKLDGIPKTFVAFHELAHHWLHYPGQQFKWGFESKMDFEANLVAACSLVPLTLLESHNLGEIHKEFGYPFELIQFREQVYRDWKI